jgi:hypothetical protein
VCKVRGITLNYTAAQLINFDSIREMILSNDDDIITVHTNRKIKKGAGMFHKVYGVGFNPLISLG